VLKKNSKKLQVDPARREPEPRTEFDGSLRKLGPLRERIKLKEERPQQERMQTGRHWSSVKEDAIGFARDSGSREGAKFR
jgi:hypothetical protein